MKRFLGYYRQLILLALCLTVAATNLSAIALAANDATTENVPAYTLEAAALTGDIFLLVPPSVAHVTLQQASFDSKALAQEIRAYTIQQSLYWPLAAAILLWLKVNL